MDETIGKNRTSEQWFVMVYTKSGKTLRGKFPCRWEENTLWLEGVFSAKRGDIVQLTTDPRPTGWHGIPLHKAEKGKPK